MKTKTFRLSITLTLGMGLTLALLWLMGSQSQSATAAPAAELHVCPSGCTYSSVQDAVDAANEGDIIKVAAGTYTGVSTREGETQVVYISKTVTVRGGYTTTNGFADPPDPDANPTTLDAQEQGRVLFIGGNITPTIEGLRITEGSSDAGGGGIYVISATVTISSSQVFNNDAYSGGGLYLKSSPAVLVGNIVSSNETYAYGGGLYLEESPATLSGNVIASNSAFMWSGGGLYLWHSDATISGNTVAGNSAHFGGGLYLYESDATLGGNTVVGNNSAGPGGGLHLSNSDAALNGNTITGNDAESGGGLSLYESDGAVLSGNTIISNSAEFYGGGVELKESNSTFVNNVIADNQADTVNGGGGASIDSSVPKLLHTTLARNGDSGIRIDGTPGNYSYVILRNTILADHETLVFITQGNGVELESTLYYSYTDAPVVCDPAPCTVIQTHNYLGDPAFVDPDAGNYHIGPDSAARDRGVDAGVESDIDGDPRPAGSGYDLGADEYLTAVLDVVKQPSETYVDPGQTLTYTILITNTGAQNATGVVLTDTLDGWQRAIAATSSSGGCSVTDGGWGGTAVCSPGTIVTGTTVVVTLTTQVSTAVMAGQVMTNTVVVASNEATSSAQANTYVIGPIFDIAKQPSETYVSPGQVLTYTILITNTGTGNATSVVLTDTLDSWQRAITVASSTGECSVTDGGWGGTAVCSPGTIVTNATVIVTLTAQVSTTVSAGQAMTNTVVVASNETTNSAYATTYAAGEITGCYVRINDDPKEYTAVQTAVDAANPGDLVKVGGYCIGVTSRTGITQVVYISKTITIQGGYSPDNWTTPDPEANPTTLDAQGLGRVVYITGDISPTIEGLRITGGDATGLGGGLWGDDAGGGIYIVDATATISNNYVFSNTVPWYGGGVYLLGDATTLNGNTITSNAAGVGGGLALDLSWATLDGNAISDNWAWSAGGGLYQWLSGAMLNNNIIVENRTNSSGSAMYIEDSFPLLQHTTIAGNTGGDGSGIYVTNFLGYSSVSLINTILVSHTVGITATAGSTVTLEATMWGAENWANTADWGGAGTIITGTVNIRGNPAFADPDSGDYHIGPDSAARDAGVDAGVASDIDGETRPHGAACDIGADEFWPRPALSVTKQASSIQVQAGDTLTYAISITNTGNVTLTATITDILPAQVMPSGILTWTTSIAAPGGVWTKQFTVAVNAGYAGVLTNVVQVATKEGATGAYTHTVSTLPTVDFSSPFYDMSESGGSAIITVTLSQASALTATVDYASGGGTATAGQDYTSASGTLVFTPGVTSQMFTVPITQDSWDEYDETVTLTLSNADNATIGGNNPATLTIEDDDDPPNLSISDASITEGDSGSVSAVFSVALSVASGKPITAEYATADGSAIAPDDYTAIYTTTLVFDPDITTQLLTVTVKGDTLDEDDETLFVSLANATNAGITDGQGQGTILDDDDPPSLSISDASVTEGDSGSVSAVFTVTLSTVSGRMVTVEYATADGSATAPDDYTAISTTTLTFDPGVITQLVAITVKGDTLDEDNETFWLNLASPVNAGIADAQGQGIIQDDDDPPSLSISDTSVTEGDSGSVSAVFTVTLSDASGKTVTVEYATADGSATAPADYAAVSATALTFDPGVTTRLITITVKGDTLDEDHETFFVNLANATNATIADGQGQGTIQDDDGPPTVDFSAATYSVNEDAGTVAVVVTLDPLSALTVTVKYTATGGTATLGEDYAIISGTGTLTFTPGVTSRSFPVNIVDDEIDEGEETIILMLYDPTNATIGGGTAVLTITEEFKVYLPIVLRNYP